MTAEQILEKHLSLMLKRTEKSYVSIDEMKKQPEWQATINAMLEYGEMQALRTDNIVKQSEQFYCVSSDALIYKKPCTKWCGDENCKTLCRQ